MAADRDVEENTQNRSDSACSMVIDHHDRSPGGSSRAGRPPVIFNPDFFVEKLRHESPDVFLELVLSNITRLIDLPGTEFSQLLGDEAPKTPTGGNGGFFRSFNFLKRKDKGVVFGTPLTESCIAQIYQLIEYLSKNLHVEGLFRVPGNSVRQQTLRELLNGGADVDLESGDFHPNDVATLLKTFLGELPEPLLTHRHFHAHLKIADMTLFDDHGNKTTVPNKERQIEALQLLFLLLPQANRSLLKLLLDLLYHTARQQDKNKMSAFNLALMFAPHVLWPRHMTAGDLKDNLKKLNSSMSFLIKHSQKLFRAPVYLREYARVHFSGTKALHTKDDLELLAASGSPAPRSALPLKRTAALGPGSQESPAQQYTEEALKELFRHVHHNMPDSAKKKKLVRQLVKQTTSGTPPTNEHHQGAPSKKHPRSRSFGGLIKRKARGEDRRVRHVSPEAVNRAGRKAGKENVILRSVNSPLNGPVLGKVGLVVKNPDFAFTENKALKVSKQAPPSVSRMCFSPEISV
ncbi:putative rho GTPase-activating protein 19-like [Scophthalmus maximus]|uniref:Rho GTPase-activating protein 19 n=1 Tax=Scophthalmus maximus TaxID=52904 RepID=A0A2U9BM15_SCOMX|nr:rho GTPase-activating protein 19 isoform X1 [Scophthalmus maximus]AWP05134.1 putative rho GTPase-activating protein 19-like [Scophthalmus maximus]